MASAHNEHPGELVDWRLGQLEEAVRVMAQAADAQQDFNMRVERFMERVATWGRVALIAYLGVQGLVVGVILFGIPRLGS
jgi:hypothetical protein